MNTTKKQQDKEKLAKMGTDSFIVGYQQAISEFKEKLKERIKFHLDCADVDGRRIVYHMTDKDYDEFFDIIDKTAQEMK